MSLNKILQTFTYKVKITFSSCPKLKKKQQIVHHVKATCKIQGSALCKIKTLYSKNLKTLIT